MPLGTKPLLGQTPRSCGMGPNRVAGQRPGRWGERQALSASDVRCRTAPPTSEHSDTTAHCPRDSRVRLSEGNRPGLAGGGGGASESQSAFGRRRWFCQNGLPMSPGHCVTCNLCTKTLRALVNPVHVDSEVVAEPGRHVPQRPPGDMDSTVAQDMRCATSMWQGLCHHISPLSPY